MMQITGIWSSIAILVCISLLFWLGYKPRFVLPTTTQTLVYKISKIIALVVLVLLPLQIQLPTNKTDTISSVPIQILFDVSLSMAANDIEPSRFTAAKAMVDTLLDKRDGYPVSLILFSGIPFVHVPFSTHTASVRAKRATTHLGQSPPVPQFVGTAIGDALLLGIHNLEQNAMEDGIMILITDGDANKGYEPSEVLGIVQKKYIPIFTIGIGQSDDYIVGYDRFGGEVLTKYNPVFLQEISDATGGSSWVAEDTDSINTILAPILSAVEERLVESTIVPQRNLNNILLCILAGWILAVTGWRILVWYTKK